VPPQTTFFIEDRLSRDGGETGTHWLAGFRLPQDEISRRLTSRAHLLKCIQLDTNQIIE